MELPEVLHRQRVDDGVCLQLEIRPDLKWFIGHFPGRPVLPGVVQIAWAVYFSRESFAFPSGVSSLDQIKFKRPIGPGRHVILLLGRRSADNIVRFEYRDDHASLATGLLTFSASV
jgi:3-hydroxyacyl-[acyl-carrier-protein] dehydratase